LLQKIYLIMKPLLLCAIRMSKNDVGPSCAESLMFSALALAEVKCEKAI